MIGKTNAISGGTQPVLITKNININGTYLASDDSADGYSQVVVDVSNFAKYHIEQIINGDTSELIITDYNGQATNNYLVGTITDGDTQQMYIVDENERKISNLKDFIDLRGAWYLFYKYNGEPLENILSYSDTSDVTDMRFMFAMSQISTIPLFDTRKVTNMAAAFDGCENLISVSALDVSKVTNLSLAFSSCDNLEEIHMTGMKVGFDISDSTQFTEAALVEILNNLATVSSRTTLTMGATNLAKLTAEEIAIATNKGWTLT